MPIPHSMIYFVTTCLTVMGEVMHCDQYGFRQGHSTELASVRFVNDLIQQMDNFKIPTSILIDLSKA